MFASTALDFDEVLTRVSVFSFTYKDYCQVSIS